MEIVFYDMISLLFVGPDSDWPSFVAKARNVFSSDWNYVYQSRYNQWNKITCESICGMPLQLICWFCHITVRMECSCITVDKMQIAKSKKSCSIRVRNTKHGDIFLHRVEKWSSHLSNISYRYLKHLGYFNRIRTPDLCSTNYTKPRFYTLGIFKRQ